MKLNLTTKTPRHQERRRILEKTILYLSSFCLSWRLGALVVIVVIGSPVLAQEDDLSAPKADNQPHLVKPKAPSEDPSQSNAPNDVVDQKPGASSKPDEPVTDKTGTPAATSHPPETPSPLLTQTPVPAVSPAPAPAHSKKSKSDKPDKHATITPTPMLTATPRPLPRITSAQVTTIPNPARGKKMAFRIMTAGHAKARIVVYNNFMDKVTTLEAEGDHLFDILWPLRDVPEGIYYYQAQIENTDDGLVQKLPLQNFAVMKDEGHPPSD